VEFLEVCDAHTNHSVLKDYCISQPYVTFSCWLCVLVFWINCIHKSVNSPSVL